MCARRRISSGTRLNGGFFFVIPSIHRTPVNSRLCEIWNTPGGGSCTFQLPIASNFLTIFQKSISCFLPRKIPISYTSTFMYNMIIVYAHIIIKIRYVYEGGGGLRVYSLPPSPKINSRVIYVYQSSITTIMGRWKFNWISVVDKISMWLRQITILSYYLYLIKV